MPWETFVTLPTGQLIGLICIFLACFLGLIGNTLSVIVFSKTKFQSSVVLNVVGLTICDSLTLSMELLLLCLNNLAPIPFIKSIIPLFPWMFALTSVGQGGSVYFTTVISAERFIALCRPFKALAWCTRRNALYVCAGVFALAISTTLPRLFQYEVMKVPLNTTGLNLTEEEIANAWEWSITDPPKSATYIAVNNTVLIGLRFVIPWAALVTLNTLIYLQIRRSNKARQQMNEQQQSDVSIAKTLLCVVLVFFISNVPFAVAYLETLVWGQISPALAIVTELFIVMNAAVNFLIYVFIGKRFRNTLILILSKNGCFQHCVKAKSILHSHQMHNLSSRSMVTISSTDGTV